MVLFQEEELRNKGHCKNHCAPKSLIYREPLGPEDSQIPEI